MHAFVRATALTFCVSLGEKLRMVEFPEWKILATDPKGREFHPLPSSRFLVNTLVKNSAFKFVLGGTNDFL